MTSYADAKRKLFSLPGLRSAVINIDDNLGKKLVSEFSNKLNLITYSVSSSKADIYAKDTEFNFDSINTTVVTPFGSSRISVPLLGEFNVSNILASLASLLILGEKFEEIIKALKDIKPIKGRMEIIPQEIKKYSLMF